MGVQGHWRKSEGEEKKTSRRLPLFVCRLFSKIPSGKTEQLCECAHWHGVEVSDLTGSNPNVDTFGLDQPAFLKACVWRNELPGCPFADIHRDVESVSHIASAAEAVGHWESGGCSGWETSSHPVQSNTFSLRQYTNIAWFYLEGNHCVVTGWSSTLWVQLVL